LSFLSYVIFVLCGPNKALAEDKELGPADWKLVYKLANETIVHESPDNVWPFERVRDNKGDHHVFAHYFTPFPLSLDNLPPADDYYAREFLRRSGEHGKYAQTGGYLRERPLSRPPWANAYWEDIDLAIDVLRADLIGLDGFGVDLLLLDGPLWRRTQKLYAAAAAVAPSFHIIAEPDMASLKDVSEPQLGEALAKLLAHKAAYRLPDGRALVVPFMAEARPPEFWQQLSDDLASRGLPIALMPDFLNPSGKKAYASTSYGFTYWGLRDPIAAAAHPSDRVFAASGFPPNAAFMAPVAPQDERPKDAIFWEAHNTTLFRMLWMQAINGPAQYVHLITWNDYSEASEISPSTGTHFV
jgi:hypothetical protein